MNKPMKPCLLEFLPDQDEKWLTALLAPAPDESESLRRGRQFLASRINTPSKPEQVDPKAFDKRSRW